MSVTNYYIGKYFLDARAKMPWQAIFSAVCLFFSVAHYADDEFGGWFGDLVLASGVVPHHAVRDAEFTGQGGLPATAVGVGVERSQQSAVRLELLGGHDISECLIRLSLNSRKHLPNMDS